MDYFGLHADTPSRLLYDRLPFSSGLLDISESEPTFFGRFSQVFACFCRENLSNEEAYRDFFRMRGRLLQTLSSSPADFQCYLAVEDARLLNGDPTRVEQLANAGVSLLTFLWKGETCIGGAYDTDAGLTDFGKKAVKEALCRGVVPDVSHASEASFYDMATLCAEAGLPCVATHSNAYSVCPHRRNLKDEQFRLLLQGGGIVGICFYPPHLTEGPTAGIADVLRHIDHFLSLGGENALCLGTDFDGISAHPIGLDRPRDLWRLAEAMQNAGYSDELINGIFYQNANDFFKKAGSYELQKYKKSQRANG